MRVLAQFNSYLNKPTRSENFQVSDGLYLRKYEQFLYTLSQSLFSDWIYSPNPLLSNKFLDQLLYWCALH